MLILKIIVVILIYTRRDEASFYVYLYYIYVACNRYRQSTLFQQSRLQQLIIMDCCRSFQKSTTTSRRVWVDTRTRARFATLGMLLNSTWVLTLPTNKKNNFKLIFDSNDNINLIILFIYPIARSENKNIVLTVCSSSAAVPGTTRTGTRFSVATFRTRVVSPSPATVAKASLASPNLLLSMKFTSM